MPLQNDRFIKALLCQDVDRTPTWIMRQAGRYLPEYRKVRANVGGFMDLCKNPELACEVTLQPLERFDLDAAIIFSDILTIPDAMGLGLHFVEGEGPKFSKPITSKSMIENLSIPDPESDLGYVMKAISTTKKALANKLPLIGFSGSPWTLATYMVEGGPSKQFEKIKGLMFQEPKTLHLLLDKLADSVIAYLNAQIANGVNAVMIFDTWGGILSPHHYQEFSLRYMNKIIAGLTKTVNDETIPSIIFTKNGGNWLKDIAASGCNGVGVDWTFDIGQAAQALEGSNVAIQGNMDPITLLGNEETIKAEAKKILDKMKNYPGHVFNLGHGILPMTPPEHLAFLINYIKEVG